MMTKTDKKLNIAAPKKTPAGFSLIEIVTVMVISSMVIISTIAIFNHVRKATASVNSRLDSKDVAGEVLQRIAQDLDKLALPGFDTRVTIKNRLADGFNKCRLTIENEIYDEIGNPKTFEKIVWQSQFDPLEGMVILYRYHGGLNLEDKIIGTQLYEEQSDGTEIYVPICWGMTMFQIDVPRKDADPLTVWTSTDLPKSLSVKISFAEPVENFDGTLEIPESEILTRNIAIDRTRKVPFVFKKKDFTRAETDDENDPNQPDSDTENYEDKNEEKIETETGTNRNDNTDSDISVNSKKRPAR